MHDIDIFPLYINKKEIKSAGLLISFIKEQKLLGKFDIKLGSYSKKESKDIILSLKKL